MRPICSSIVGIALALCAAAAPAAVITLQQDLDGYMGVEDTFCDGWDTSYYPPWRNHGGDDTLRYYQTISTARRKILIRFAELDSAIPVASDLVLSATLGLYHYHCEYVANPQTDNVALYRVLKDWQEGSSTDNYVPQTGMSCRYRHEPNHTPDPADWTQNAGYDRVWELTVSETVNQCMFDEGAGGNQWTHEAGVEAVHNNDNSWYQEGGTLYVNKGDDNVSNPSESGSYPYSGGFAYYYASDMWEAEAATGPSDIDQQSPILAAWDDYDSAYNPADPGDYEGSEGWVSVEITDWVKAWMDAPAGNFGLLIARNQHTAGKYFRSSEYNAGTVEDPNWTLGPKLVVEYVPEPVTLLLLAVGGIAALRRRRRR